MRQQAKGYGPWTRTCNVDWPLSLWHRKSGETENASPVDVEHLLVGRRCLHAPSTQPRRRGVSATLPLPPLPPPRDREIRRDVATCATRKRMCSRDFEDQHLSRVASTRRRWGVENNYLFANLGTCSQYQPAFRKENRLSIGWRASRDHPCLPHLTSLRTAQQSMPTTSSCPRGSPTCHLWFLLPPMPPLGIGHRPPLEPYCRSF